MTTHTMSWRNIRRSMKRLRRRQAEEIMETVQRWLRDGAEPDDIRCVTGHPLKLIGRIRPGHQDFVAEVMRWTDGV